MQSHGRFRASVRRFAFVTVLAATAGISTAAEDDVAALFDLVERAATAGAHDRAIRLCTQIAARADLTDAQRARALERRAGLWARVCEFGRAIDDYSEVIRLAPQHGPAYSLRGYLRSLCGMHAQAALDHRQAVELAPRFKEGRYLAWALQHEADMWRRRRSFDKALAVCAQALKASDYPVVHLRRAWIHLDQGDDAKALAAYATFKAQKHSLEGMWPDERLAIERLERLIAPRE